MKNAESKLAAAETLKTRIDQAAGNIEPSEYILPFHWMHGEPHEQLKEEIDAIYNANIREFCLESRTHAQFGEDKWWEDMGFVLKYAKERGMRVWLLDDKFFPTGFANAYVNTHPELKRVEIRMEYRDFAGPRSGIGIRCAGLREGERFVSVTAYRRDPVSGAITGEGTDLTGLVLTDGGMRDPFTWDVPKGVWRIFYIIRTTYAPGRPEYIDMLSPESCKAMIHAVYQPHYEHFSDYFGNTFAGYFSDEPCFANDFGTYYSILGKAGMMVPYRDDICELIGKAAGISAEEARVRLPELFHPHGEGKHMMMRWAYMDVVSKLYAVNFSSLLGEWSRAHNVQYIGHIIEDANTHQRLGHGPGHYFRAIAPMDMAGIDIVLNQYLPGMPDLMHSAPVFGSEADPEFYNYLITALPASLSRLEPHMRGRTMCEIFGAFGWAEGVPMMKKMLDRMLSGGINHFVPHAFTPKYPDPDCPPHFYGKGNIMQFRAFGQLMRYMSRMAHILSGGNYPADVAVLYNAEAEWCGGRCDTLQRTAKTIGRAHIAFDIVWEDILGEFEVKNGKASVRGRQYSALVVPESPFLPPELIKALEKLEKSGLPVVIDAPDAPENALNGIKTTFRCVSGAALAEFLFGKVGENGCLKLDRELPLLKYYRCADNAGGEALFLYSEDDFNEMRFTLVLSDGRERRFYDAWDNKFYMPRQNGKKIEVVLPPSGSALIVTDDRDAAPYDYRDAKNIRPADFDCEKVTLIYPDGKIVPTDDIRPGCDVSTIPGLETFHGIIRYEGTLGLAEGDKTLRITEVGEIVNAVLDGKELGTRLERDCAFDISGIEKGRRRLVLDVVNSPARMIPDGISSFIPIPRSGLTGTMTVEGS
ncbi:MAG: hypothetical protein J5950_01530 [Clostridia bacterium]|nr:hypothetical protein [Clostridia bacterium]